MTKYRITADLDLDLADEAAAREFAKRFVIQFTDEQMLAGNAISDSPELPEDRIDRLLESPRAVATSAFLGLLRVGLGSAPFANITRCKAQADPQEA